MDLFFECAHRSILLDRENRIVRMVRSATPIGSTEECARLYEETLRAMEPLDRAAWSLLLDVRLAALRSDPALDAVVIHYRRETSRGFARVATLVATDTQMLQFRRYAREHGDGSFLFLDEAQAVAYLRDGTYTSALTSRVRREP